MPYGPLPTPAQLKWHETEMYCLIHYGVDTYTDKEWGYGDEDPAIVNPAKFSAEQIVSAAKAGGFKGVIVVAKHHDGLCLWPTKTTEHNISKSPWKNGKGDIVKEFRIACDKLGMKLGIYCSPWDRNSSLYGTPEYVSMYRQQLKELYRNYGPLFISWHDGANGGDGYYGGSRGIRKIDRTSYYGWDTIFSITRKMQPSAVIFGDIGPDVRWVGNEHGYAGDTCWSTFTPQAPDDGKKPSNGYSKYWLATKGTKNGKYWMPAECDVPLRPGWFYHAAQDSQVKSPNTLLELYYKSVGRGADLDLGLAPNREGRLHANDVKTLAEFGQLLKEIFSENLARNARLTASNIRGNNTKKYGPSLLLDNDRYSYWATDDDVLHPELVIDLGKNKTFNVIRLRENIKLGQRITSFAIYAFENGQWKELASATSIGANRLIRLSRNVITNKLRLRITGANACIALSDFGLFKEPDPREKFLFKNARVPIDERVEDLLNHLTLVEKISLLGYNSKAVPRLGIPAYNWWNEALHGVARAGKATVFPQAIGAAASFNPELLNEEAGVISTEARAKYNLAIKQGRRLQYMGLTFWSPNINIFRDPRWGRGQETYGEDPFLTATMGSAFVQGLQGNDPNYLKASAGAKHFAVHSGPEAGRHTFNVIIDEKDLRETYLYAFKKLVDAGVETIMCAYNRVNNEPCCTGNTLLHNILHDEWKFKGHVVTDCWALDDVWLRHKVLENSVQTAAAAIKAGVNLDCSNLLQDDVMKAIRQNLLTEKEVDSALVPILRTQIKLGFYDPVSLDPYAHYGEDSVSNSYHKMLARKMAQQSMVLLKNDKNILPLNKNNYGAFMVVGPNAASLDALLGNYHGVSDKAVNFVEGITSAVNSGTRVEYDQGCDFTDTVHFGGTWAAGNADVTIAVIGFTAVYEGEEGDAFLAEGGGDRKSLSLPASHVAYIKALRKGNRKPIIAVITGGSAVDVSAISPYVDAIILAWYPGEQGGNALADILFGKVSPSGHLPVTFYTSLQDLPVYDDYNLKGRTYRYFDGKVQYPFGFGLSYTSFSYSDDQPPAMVNSLKDTLAFSINIRNTGMMDGDAVAQVYIQYPAIERMPLKELKSFKRVHLAKGKEKKVRFAIPLSELQKWDLQLHKWVLYPGDYSILTGSNSQDIKLRSTVKIRD